MAKILKNTTANAVFLQDSGTTIAANEAFTIHSSQYLVFASSNEVIQKISDGTLIVSDGTNDLSISDGVDLLKGMYPKKIVGASDNTEIGNVGDRLKVDIDTSTTPIITAFDDAETDAFGRLRVSNPESLLDYTFEYDKQPLIFSELLTSGGTATYDNNKKSVILTCTATNGSSAKFRSKRYLKYHPGKSQLILMTGSFNGAHTGTVKRIGQYDEDNGFYFELNGSDLSINLRSKTSGSVVNTSILQSNWNLDKLDGLGTSGETVDITKQQIFIIDYQWLGSGRIRFGFNINGSIYYCHEIHNSNILSLPYSQTATLPVGGEISGTGTSGSLWLTCGTVMSEGSYAIEGIIRTANSGCAPRNLAIINSTAPIIALRTKTSYNKVPIKIEDFGIFAGSTDDFLVTLIMNPTLTGGTWNSLNGACEVNNTATEVSGGIELYSTYLRGGNNVSSIQISDALLHANNFILGLNIDGTRDVIALVATNLTAIATAYGFINYRELL